MMDGMLPCRPILCRIQRQIHQSLRFFPTEWDTMNIFTPNMPDLVLPCLYCCCPHRPTYLLMSLSSSPHNIESILLSPSYLILSFILYLLLSHRLCQIHFSICSNKQGTDAVSEIAIAIVTVCLFLPWFQYASLERLILLVASQKVKNTEPLYAVVHCCSAGGETIS